MPRFDPGPAFRELHRPGNPFVLANAWDMGSARMLAAMGAKAIGTTSAGHAFTLGRPDMGHVSMDEALAHAETLVSATDLPVSGDFENGFGHAPDDVANCVRASAEVGLAGISIEDTDLPDVSAYQFDFAVDRIRAAVGAARALPRDFVLVARADGIMNGAYDIDEAIKRLKAFATAGADCIYAPLPKTFEDLTRIVKATKTPVNVLAAGPFTRFTRHDFARIGIARISLGSALARVTHKAISQAMTPLFENGDFSNLRGMSGSTVDDMLRDGAPLVD